MQRGGGVWRGAAADGAGGCAPAGVPLQVAQPKVGQGDGRSGVPPCCACCLRPGRRLRLSRSHACDGCGCVHARRRASKVAVVERKGAMQPACWPDGGAGLRGGAVPVVVLCAPATSPPVPMHQQAVVVLCALATPAAHALAPSLCRAHREPGAVRGRARHQPAAAPPPGPTSCMGVPCQRAACASCGRAVEAPPHLRQRAHACRHERPACHSARPPRAGRAGHAKRPLPLAAHRIRSTRVRQSAPDNNTRRWCRCFGCSQQAVCAVRAVCFAVMPASCGWRGSGMGSAPTQMGSPAPSSSHVDVGTRMRGFWGFGR